MKIHFRLSDERLITPTGISLVGQLLATSNFIRIINRLPMEKKRSQPQIPTGDILLCYIALLCQAKTCFDAYRELEADREFYKLSLGLKKGIASPETARQRMDYLAENASVHTAVLDACVTMFEEMGIQPSPEEHGFVPIDADVSCMDNSNTHKELVSRTYAGYDGYAPMFAYIGTEGFLLDAELREGKQHSQKHTPDFLRELLYYGHKMTDKPLLVRLDSGNDSADNYGILLEDGSWFIVKRNPRTESKEEWAKHIKEWCKNPQTPREGKTVYIGTTWKDVTYTVEKNGQKEQKTIRMRIVYEMIERTIDKYGQILLMPEIELNMWWTNLGWSDADIIASYHAHGECEQYHSEIKTDMDVERLPSGKFKTNALVLDLTILAFNILRIIGYYSVRTGSAPKTKRPVKRRRIRTVIDNLIRIAGHLTKHAGRVIMSLGRCNAWRHNFLDVLNAIAGT